MKSGLIQSIGGLDWIVLLFLRHSGSYKAAKASGRSATASSCLGRISNISVPEDSKVGMLCKLQTISTERKEEEGVVA